MPFDVRSYRLLGGEIAALSLLEPRVFTLRVDLSQDCRVKRSCGSLSIGAGPHIFHRRRLDYVLRGHRRGETVNCWQYPIGHRSLAPIAAFAKR